MPEKAEDPEAKKECPSCGLGVPSDARVCEFCGWDFEEEDEWIVQIEKLERDLLHEKQKFKPGTVDHMIETTLRTPGPEMTETAHEKKASEPAAESGPSVSGPEETREEAGEVMPQEPAVEQAVEETAGGPVRQERAAARPAQAAPAPKVRRIRTVRTPSAGQPVASAERAGPSPAEDEPEREEPAKGMKGLLSGLMSSKAKEQPGKEPPRERKTRVIRKVKE